LKDSPKAVAGGFAWGSFVHFYPTFGFGPVFAVTLAHIFQSNIFAATVGWIVTMPLFPFFFYLNLKVGEIFIGGSNLDIALAMKEIIDIKFSGLLYIGKAFFLGSLINGIAGVILIRWLCYLLLRRFRKRTLLFINRNL
jgi:uncharacterized protein (DUF2062 family)